VEGVEIARIDADVVNGPLKQGGEKGEEEGGEGGGRWRSFPDVRTSTSLFFRRRRGERERGKKREKGRN